MDLLLRLREKAHRRRNQWLILLAVSGVGIYKFYHLPSVATKRKRLTKLLNAIVSVSESISDSAETISIVSKDLKKFLNSDSDEIPNSLKQISKITKSNEFTDSLSKVSQAISIGAFRGDSRTEKSETSDVVESVIDKVFSKDASGFVSAVVGSFAKNLVLGFCESDSSSETTTTPRWVSLVCDDKCREVLADCIQRFTSTLVAVYLEKTMEINTYDQIFEGLTNPKHQDSVKEVLVSVCNGALETLVRTSHQVFTSETKESGFNTNGSESVDGIKSSSSGWAESITTTLAVPSNRKFLFDVTGRVTLETTRSIIGFIMLKMSQGFRKSINVAHEEITDRGGQVVGYVGAKSSVIFTVFLALYLHIVSGGVRNPPIGVSQHF